jgi:putative ABC transport system substrate-binding protein
VPHNRIAFVGLRRPNVVRVRRKKSFDRAGELAARILAGASPVDLPSEEPTHYPLLINLKTAKATGIDLPDNLLALADEVIE